MSDKNESFIRWQGRMIEQLGFVNNLLIFLATGLMAFQIQLAVTEKSFNILEKYFVVLSMSLIFISLMIGCYLAWNRLKSFRITAQVARKREKGNKEGLEDLRKQYRILDERTWQLLSAQTFYFALGSLVLILFTIIYFICNLS